MWILFWPAHLWAACLKDIYNEVFWIRLFLNLSDLYQITMAYAYWKSGKRNETAVFDLYFRKNPFKGEFTVFAGLEECIKFVKNFKFSVSGMGFILHLSLQMKIKVLTLHVNDIDKSYLFFQHSYIYFIVYIFRYQLLKNSFTRKYWGWIFWLSSKSNNWRGTTNSNRWRNGSFPQSSPHLHRGTSPRGSANGDTSTESR